MHTFNKFHRGFIIILLFLITAVYSLKFDNGKDHVLIVMYFTVNHVGL